MPVLRLSLVCAFQDGKSVQDVAADSGVSTQVAAESVQQRVESARTLTSRQSQRRLVRADSISQFLEVTALTPTPEWRTDQLRSKLTASSDLVRDSCAQ